MILFFPPLFDSLAEERKHKRGMIRGSMRSMMLDAIGWRPAARAGDGNKYLDTALAENSHEFVSKQKAFI
jgi:hypothetical protein